MIYEQNKKTLNNLVFGNKCKVKHKFLLIGKFYPYYTNKHLFRELILTLLLINCNTII